MSIVIEPTVSTVSDNYQVDWYDDDQTIVMVTVSDVWTWNDAELGARRLSKLIKSLDYSVNVIYQYKGTRAAQLPRGNRVFANLKRMMEVSSMQPNAIYMVNASSLMQGFMRILSQAYGLDEIYERFHFVDSLDVALKAIGQEPETTAPVLTEPARNTLQPVGWHTTYMTPSLIGY